MAITRNPTIWTLAYRKRTANRFLRIDLALTWHEAMTLARRVRKDSGYDVWYTTTAHAEATGHVVAEDVGNILADSGKRVRVAEGGTLAALGLTDQDVAACIAEPDEFAGKVTRRAPSAEPLPGQRWAASMSPDAHTAPAAPVLPAAPADAPPGSAMRLTGRRAHRQHRKTDRKAQRAARRRTRR